MGCDIHLHIEVEVNGKWEHYGAPSIERSYKLFEKLAGVRGDIKNAISAPKGLPNNVSTITEIERKYWGLDGHSDSWLDHDEIIKLEDWLTEFGHANKLSGMEYDLEWGILHTYLNDASFTSSWRYESAHLPEGITDVRFVFWFDN